MEPDGRSPAERLHWALEAPLDTLPVPELQVHPAGIEEWDIPATDRDTLTRHGLPRLAGTRFAPATDPRRLHHGDTDLYVLGELPNLTVGAVPGSGQVIGVRQVTTIPVVLGSALPPVVHVNATVAAFVEWTWRWHWIHWALPGETGYDHLDQIWARIRAADPTTDRDPAQSLWHGLVEGW